MRAPAKSFRQLGVVAVRARVAVSVKVGKSETTIRMSDGVHEGCEGLRRSCSAKKQEVRFRRREIVSKADVHA